MIIGLTGHRPDKLYGYDLSDIRYLFLKEKLKEILIAEKCSEGVTGMALGADMVWALAIIDLKKQGYNIKLHCAIPCVGHKNKWTDKKSIELYDYILTYADSIHINNKKYDRFCMQERNMYMVDISDKMIAVYSGGNGGTKNCIDYTIQQKKEIIYINPIQI